MFIIPAKSCSSTKRRLYNIGSSVVTNSKYPPQGDQAADLIAPFATVQRSGVHLSVFHTRKTFPTVVVHKRRPSGDHNSKEHGGPTRLSGVLVF